MKPNISVSIYITLAVILAIFAFPQSNQVYAEIFKWKDEAGKTHYTNSLSEVPKKYRNKGLEARGEEGETFNVPVDNLIANGRKNRKFRSFDEAILKYMKVVSAQVR
jgi:hypothetical protein